MAMVKPIAQSKNAFDATKPEYFSFTSVGGNQVVKNKITIRDNVTNAVVYTNTVETFASGQEVPANKLTNGKYYNYFFNTFDISGTMSPDSNIISFYCYTQPKITFLNVTNNSTIESSNFMFIAEYTQIQGELLDNLQFTLYDIDGSVLSSSPVLYALEAPPTQFAYSFDGMENNTSYRIKAEGVTINGTKVSSDMITFEIRFENPAVYTKIDLENKCNDGYIQFRSNLVFVDAISNPDPPKYINGTAVDVSKLGEYVEWIEGFEIPSGFILQLWMNPALLGEFCKLWNKSNLNDYIQLNLRRSYYTGSDYPKDCFEVYAKQGTNYVRKYSNVVEALNNLSDIIVWVKKVGDTWELNLDVVNRNPSVLEWNSEYENESNVEYNKITDMFWNDDFVPFIRYSPNADGSNMTDKKESTSKYMGTTKVPFSEFIPDPIFDGYVMNDNSYLADKFSVDYLPEEGTIEFYTGSGLAPEDTWYSQVDSASSGLYVMDKVKYKLTPEMRENFELVNPGEYTFSVDVKCNKYGGSSKFSCYMGGEKNDGTMEQIFSFGSANIVSADYNHIELKASYNNKNIDWSIYKNIWIVLPAEVWNGQGGSQTYIQNLSVYGKGTPENKVETWLSDKSKFEWTLIPGEFAKDT